MLEELAFGFKGAGVAFCELAFEVGDELGGFYVDVVFGGKVLDADVAFVVGVALADGDDPADAVFAAFVLAEDAFGRELGVDSGGPEVREEGDALRFERGVVKGGDDDVAAAGGPGAGSLRGGFGWCGFGGGAPRVLVFGHGGVELLPSEVEADGVLFAFGASELGAVACNQGIISGGCECM